MTVVALVGALVVLTAVGRWGVRRDQARRRARLLRPFVAEYCRVVADALVPFAAALRALVPVVREVAEAYERLGKSLDGEPDVVE